MSQSNSKIRFVFFGSSRFSTFVLDELKNAGFEPILNITNARDSLPMDKLRELKADVFIVASFGNILPEELIYLPAYKTLNVHPSLLPKLRGPAPIQGTIIKNEKPGVTIIRMDEKMDHGPILAQEEVPLEPWPDHYSTVEEKLGGAGGKLLAKVLPQWIAGEITEIAQDDSEATYVKLIKKEDGLLDLSQPAEENLRKVLAYSTWPGAYFFHQRKDGKKIRVVIKKAELENCDNENSLKIVNCKLKIISVIPEGKKEMDWQDFLRGNQ